MRLWTIQGIELYEQLVKEGVTYCTKPAWGDEENFMYAYHWMAEQMRKRIGEPPIEGIEYPLWAWFQYDSAKRTSLQEVQKMCQKAFLPIWRLKYLRMKFYCQILTIGIHL